MGKKPISSILVHLEPMKKKAFNLLIVVVGVLVVSFSSLFLSGLSVLWFVCEFIPKFWGRPVLGRFRRVPYSFYFLIMGLTELLRMLGDKKKTQHEVFFFLLLFVFCFFCLHGVIVDRNTDTGIYIQQSPEIHSLSSGDLHFTSCDITITDYPDFCWISLGTFKKLNT